MGSKPVYYEGTEADWQRLTTAERRKIQTKEYRRVNADEIAKKQTEWRLNNPEKVAARDKLDRGTEKRRISQQRWARDNPEKMVEADETFRNTERRAKWRRAYAAKKQRIFYEMFGEGLGM